MRFVDEVQIRVTAGTGGVGCISFRREKFMPKGGPDGGDGGRGASIYFEASEDVQTLLDFRYRREYIGDDGERGHGADCYGKAAEDITLKVPVGTVIRAIDGSFEADLTEKGQRVLAAQGGKGGLGNIHFKSSTNQAPRKNTPGEVGTSRDLQLELKLVSDAGLVGFPNAGKSTLLNALTAAHSKVGDYPFTTLAPHLGVIQGMNPIILADIPGIIEGAHQGSGLGLQFLRHISRSYCLVFLVSFELNESIDRTLGILLQEVKEYDKSLLERPRFVLVNKADRLSSEDYSEEQRELWKSEWAFFRRSHPEAHLVSALENEGLESFSKALSEKLFGPSSQQMAG